MRLTKAVKQVIKIKTSEMVQDIINTCYTKQYELATDFNIDLDKVYRRLRIYLKDKLLTEVDCIKNTTHIQKYRSFCGGGTFNLSTEKELFVDHLLDEFDLNFKSRFNTTHFIVNKIEEISDGVSKIRLNGKGILNEVYLNIETKAKTLEDIDSIVEDYKSNLIKEILNESK